MILFKYFLCRRVVARDARRAAISAF